MARVPRKSAIIKSAAATFAAEGYAGASLARVAEGLGISKSAVLYHFSTKDQLLDAVLTPVSAANRDLVASYDEAPDSLEGRVELLRRLMRVYLTHSVVCTAIARDPMLWRHGTVAAGMADNYAGLVRLLCGPGAQPDCEVRAHSALLVAFRAATLGLAFDGPVEGDEAVEGVLRVCADILRS